jgi:nitrous oxidase accessory protein
VRCAVHIARKARAAGPAAALIAALLGVWVPFGRAADHIVEPGGESLQAAISAAAPGDTLTLAPGTYQGPVVVDRPLTLVGEEGAVIDGGGSGSVITVSAPDVVLRGLTVRGSGISLADQDSGIFVDKAATGALVVGNRLEQNLIGIYLWGSRDSVARDNVIVGRRDLRMNERGNGVQLWNAPGSVVEGNDIRYGRDGIFVTTSKHDIFRNNRMRDLRFAVHYMYTNASEVSGNVSQGNHLGYAIMYSNHLKILDNVSEGDRDHGLLFNYANHSTIEGNVVRGGPKKCVFIYNANKNRFHGNWFEGCDIGIHFTAGSEGNEISGNAFVDNRTQVKYVGTRNVEWSANGRGNYWSDNLAYDLNGDGVADRPYRPNDLVDHVVWRHPLARLLLNSPAVQVLRWAQSAFPALLPGGVQDSAPLMSPPRETGASREAASRG